MDKPPNIGDEGSKLDPKQKRFVFGLSPSYVVPPPLALQARITSMISAAAIAGDDSMNSIASSCAVHPRTLRRRLRAQGSSFKTLKDNARRHLAIRLLIETDMSLSRIAYYLGYSEGASLSRSCRRWYSLTPRQLRQKAQSSLALRQEDGRMFKDPSIPSRWPNRKA